MATFFVALIHLISSFVLSSRPPLIPRQSINDQVSRISDVHLFSRVFFLRSYARVHFSNQVISTSSWSIPGRLGCKYQGYIHLSHMIAFTPLLLSRPRLRSLDPIVFNFGNSLTLSSLKKKKPPSEFKTPFTLDNLYPLAYLLLLGHFIGSACVNLLSIQRPQPTPSLRLQQKFCLTSTSEDCIPMITLPHINLSFDSSDSLYSRPFSATLPACTDQSLRHRHLEEEKEERKKRNPRVLTVIYQIFGGSSCS